MNDKYATAQEARSARGEWTQRQCAELACVTLRTWQNYEWGARRMTKYLLETFLEKKARQSGE